jgi:hypothetical protein
MATPLTMPVLPQRAAPETRRKQMNEELIDAVIEQMMLDIQADDWTAIAELLNRTHEDVLVAFLSDCGMPEGESK